VRFRDTSRPVSRGPAEIYPTAVAYLGAVVIAISAATLAVHPPGARWLILAGLTILSAHLTLRMPAAVPVSFSISDIFTFSGALLFGPAAGAVLAALDAAVLSARLVNTRRSAKRILFNMSSAAIAMAAAAHLCFAASGAAPFSSNPSGIIGHAGGLALFAALYFFLNTGLVAVAIASESRRPIWDVWRDHFMALWPGYAGGGFAAGLGVFLLSAQNGDLRVLAFVLPIPFIVYITFRTAVGRMHDDVSHLTRINSMYLATIETLAQAVDARDDVTHDHLRRVQKNAMRLASTLEITDDLQLRAIEAAALLHDIGKLAIPEHILNKPDRLTPTEFGVMKLHATIGAKILEPIGFPFPVVPIVRHHHENWDGSGYPDGLRGEQIPIGARILSVVDCLDALTSDRPYRRALTPEKAFEIIGERCGVMYDPRIVNALFAIKHELCNELESPDPASPAVAESILQTRQAARPDDNDPAVTTLMVSLAGRLGAIIGREEDLRTLSAGLEEELTLMIPGLTIVIYVHDVELDGLYARAAAGIHMSAVQGLTIGLGLRLTGWVGAHRTTIANSEAALDLGNIASQLRPLPQLCLSTPIVDQGTLQGVLTIYSTSDVPFTGKDVMLIEMVAGLLAPKLASERIRTVARVTA
jgi:putative nucleotidyltransferase with HDIG domain